MTAATDCIDQSRATGSKRVAGRNNSLRSTGLLLFAFVLVASFGIAVAVAHSGARLVLPLAGIEMLVLYRAFGCVGGGATRRHSSLFQDG